MPGEFDREARAAARRVCLSPTTRHCRWGRWDVLGGMLLAVVTQRQRSCLFAKPVAAPERSLHDSSQALLLVLLLMLELHGFFFAADRCRNLPSVSAADQYVCINHIGGNPRYNTIIISDYYHILDICAINRPVAIPAIIHIMHAAGRSGATCSTRSE